MTITAITTATTTTKPNRKKRAPPNMSPGPPIAISNPSGVESLPQTTIHSFREAGSQRRLLGFWAYRRGPARPRAHGRGAGLRLALGGRGVRLGRRDGAGLAGRRNFPDQDRARHLPDPGAHPREDRDARRDPRPAVGRPDAPRPRHVRAAGLPGLARRAIRQAASTDARESRRGADVPSAAE